MALLGFTRLWGGIWEEGARGHNWLKLVESAVWVRFCCAFGEPDRFFYFFPHFSALFRTFARAGRFCRVLLACGSRSSGPEARLTADRRSAPRSGVNNWTRLSFLGGRECGWGCRRGEASGVRLASRQGRFWAVRRARKGEQAPALQTLRARVRRREPTILSAASGLEPSSLERRRPRIVSQSYAMVFAYLGAPVQILHLLYWLYWLLFSGTPAGEWRLHKPISGRKHPENPNDSRAVWS